MSNNNMPHSLVFCKDCKYYKESYKNYEVNVCLSQPKKYTTFWGWKVVYDSASAKNASNSCAEFKKKGWF